MSAAEQIKNPRRTRADFGHAMKAWLANNILRGVAHEQIVTALKQEAWPDEVIEAELAALNKHPYFKGAARLGMERCKAFGQLVNQARLEAMSARFEKVDRRKTVNSETFFTEYYAANRPLVLTAQNTHWPALKKWTPEFLKQHFADLTVTVQANTEKAGANKMYLPESTTEMHFGEFLDQVCCGRQTNDYYLVGENFFLARPEAAALHQDFSGFPGILESQHDRNRAHLWVGPGGTQTPLHNDPLNLFNCQIYGSKRFLLIPPSHTPFLYPDDACYSLVDAEHPDISRYPQAARIRPLEVILKPGDCLFLPVGWWHQVHALEPSISLTLSHFIWSNRFTHTFTV